jgi:hypothetical protein
VSLEDIEREKYEKVWTFAAYRDWSPGEGLVNEAIAALGMRPGEKVIDYGCGPGRATDLFARLGFRALGVDHAANCLDVGVMAPLILACLWDLPPLSSEWAFCCDVMEHIPEEKVDAVLAGIRARAERGAFFQICLEKDGAGPHLLGEPLHLTVKPAEWWLEKLRGLWGSVTTQRNALSAIYVCR